MHIHDKQTVEITRDGREDREDGQLRGYETWQGQEPYANLQLHAPQGLELTHLKGLCMDSQQGWPHLSSLRLDPIQSNPQNGSQSF